MGSDDWKEFIFCEKTLCKFITKEVGTASYIIFFYNALHRSIAVINGVSPHEIAEQPAPGNFFKSFQLFNIL